MADRIAIVAITRHGIALAGRLRTVLPDAQLHVPAKYSAEAGIAALNATHAYPGRTADQIARLFGEVDAIVAIFSLGAAVRMIAPHLRSKQSDPAVVVLDEAGKFVIPMLSGHLGGANALAGRLATALGATPVLTTASDVQETLAVDLLGREFGWAIEASHDELVRASAAVVNGDPVALVQEAGSKDWWAGHANGRSGLLPENIACFSRLEDLDPSRFVAVLWISARAMPQKYAARLAGSCVIYRPGERA